MQAVKGYNMKTGDLVTWTSSINEFRIDEIGVITKLEVRGDDDAKYAGAWVLWSQNQGSSYAWSPLTMISSINN